MRPVLFRIPLPDWEWLPVDALPIRGYGAMLALGFLAAIAVAAWRARREGENPDTIYTLGILALLGGIVGARLFDVMEYADERYQGWTRGLNVFEGVDSLWLVFGGVAGGVLGALGILPTPGKESKARRPIVGLWAAAFALVAGRGARIAAQPDRYRGFIDALKVTSGGLTAYGGMLLAAALIVAYLVYLRYRHGVNPLKMVDIVAPSLALGLAFGRIGCTLNGCCWGAPCDLPWCFTWPEGSLPWQAGLHGPIHPAQLYSSFNGLLLFLLLHLFYRRKPRHGVVLGAFFGLYAVSRFLLEYLRSDEAKEYLTFLGGGLSISQAVSLFVLVGVVVYFLWLPRLGTSDLLWQRSAQPSGGRAERARRRRERKKR